MRMKLMDFFQQTKTLFTTLTHIFARYSFLLHFVLMKINLSTVKWKVEFGKLYAKNWMCHHFSLIFAHMNSAHREIKIEGIISKWIWCIHIDILCATSCPFAIPNNSFKSFFCVQNSYFQKSKQQNMSEYLWFRSTFHKPKNTSE